ncbi:MFS transporter [Gilvibacter sp.]|uniref:MFS transporter n=1 Tax=Gilvibacter sp. TaxID=2729997 RepID=UPI0025BC6CEF|nr:MFS transporter [Gilvibacter sp.]NQX76855.1 MFS transporter [Gilvibacter sp.]
MQVPKHILPVIVLAQFCCTSLWFASNGALGGLVDHFNLAANALASLTSAVQLGFIVGTLVYAVLTLADRYAPGRVFAISALLGAACNAAMIWDAHSLYSLLSLRFFTGFFLAGIYPVGMKIAADYYREGLGKSLGFLVGALVLGTALPHLLQGLSSQYSFKVVLIAVSGLALFGGFLLLLTVPDGPYRKAGAGPQMTAFLQVFKNGEFRAAAFGYFGHMWELYAFWAFVPVIFQTYLERHPEIGLDISMLSFSVIGIGSFGCILAGFLARRFGLKQTAFVALLGSGVCCLLSPFMFATSAQVFIFFMLIWGLLVIADSPLFSTLVAHGAEPAIKGTALTIVNCVGFAITIVSIQLLSSLVLQYNPTVVYAILAVGPAIGLIALKMQS